MTNPPEKTALERELAEQLLDALDRLHSAMNLAIDCWRRDIERITKKGKADANGE